MGCDIHGFIEIKRDNKWQISEARIFDDEYSDDKKTATPFMDRCYSLFAFLANVRNDFHLIPISEPKGLPNDSEYLNTKLKKPIRFSYEYIDYGIAYTKKDEIEKDVDYHSSSYLTLKELLDFDYNKTFENRKFNYSLSSRDGKTKIGGAVFFDVVEEGQGKKESYKDHLPGWFFQDLELMKTLGEPENVRLIFWFDN